MKWQQIDEYHWQRACGRYAVSRALMFDRRPQGAWRYTAWKRSVAADGTAEQIGECTDDFGSAVALCTAEIALQQRSAA